MMSVKKNQVESKQRFNTLPDKDFTIFEQSQMDFRLLQILPYEFLLNKYDRILKFDLLDQRILMHEVFIAQVEIQPQNIHWIIWKNSDQVNEFLFDIQDDMINIIDVPERTFQTGKQIHDKYNSIRKQWTSLISQPNHSLYLKANKNLTLQFIELLNMMGQHPYLRGTSDFLIFIQHCVPLDKWNILIYQQLYVKQPTSFFENMTSLCTEKRKLKNDYFLTITSQGIIKSHDHLLNSKIQKMVPFTNLMKIQHKREGKYIKIQIKAGRTQHLQINFYDDYENAINFMCGLNRARIDSKYKLPYGEFHQIHQTQSRQYYQKLQQQCIKPHRFQSFAPPRFNCAVKMYNDGCGYFQDLYQCLMKAKHEICITDWMMTPFFLLKRPGTILDSNIHNRLDGVLMQAAERGVKIFIILFMEPAMFVNNDSSGAQKHLQSFHRNIKVLRHPNVAVPSIWSHHQKLCVIDQKIGFMGGLDICYGRWDTPQHHLVERSEIPEKKYWDGCDFNNYRTKDIYQPRQYKSSNLNQSFQTRMPWHDIALQMRGDSVVDLLRHFVQYWQFVKSQYEFSPRKIIAQIRGRGANIHHQTITKQIKNSTSQLIDQNIDKIKQGYEHIFSGKQPIKREMIIERRTGQNKGTTKIQMLRSANDWSIGADPQNPQRSIHQAYKNLILEAKNHIYIQNQFFMGLKNEIVKTLCARIIDAFIKKQNFKVIIVVPLLPGFEGDPGDPSSTILRIQIHYQREAILTGENSIFNILNKQCPGIRIEDYLFFFGLRTYQTLNGCPMTDIIYVHSKLMICDDKRAICGSANINDRSLWGTGDSQIAVCIQQPPEQSELFRLRCRLYEQHFQLTVNQSKDINSSKVWSKIINQAKQNTLIYRQVFGCIPDDEVTTHQQINMLSEKANYNVQKLKKIVGHAVQYPLMFMNDQDLTFSLGQKQFYAPVQSFT